MKKPTVLTVTKDEIDGIVVGYKFPWEGKAPDPNFVSQFVKGATCHCGAPATKEIEEVIHDDDPYPWRHNLTQDVCQLHFDKALRPYLFVSHDSNEYKPEK